jgi:hypothetical protein
VTPSSIPGIRDARNVFAEALTPVPPLLLATIRTLLSLSITLVASMSLRALSLVLQQVLGVTASTTYSHWKRSTVSDDPCRPPLHVRPCAKQHPCMFPSGIRASGLLQLSGKMSGVLDETGHKYGSRFCSHDQTDLHNVETAKVIFLQLSEPRHCTGSMYACVVNIGK